jgi:rod shape-determining protein MreC
MRNLLAFVAKYNAFFLFLFFEIISLTIYIKYNSFQKATFISSTSEVTGAMYTQVNGLKDYLHLKEVNDSIAKENARLRSQLKSSFYTDTAVKRQVTDSIYKQQYTFISAKVINNSVDRRTNFITIDRGSRQGVGKGMGVICSSGLVGKVVFVGEHLSVVQSLLHKDSRFSAMLANNKELGYIEWSDDLDPHKGILKDVSNNAQPKLGEQVVTSEYSLFPAGIPIGKVSNLRTRQGGYTLNMEVALAVDFSKLQYVDVVVNKLAKEQAGLETQEKPAEQEGRGK